MLEGNNFLLHFQSESGILSIGFHQSNITALAIIFPFFIQCLRYLVGSLPSPNPIWRGDC